jgi:hypothetical protein
VGPIENPFSPLQKELSPFTLPQKVEDHGTAQASEAGREEDQGEGKMSGSGQIPSGKGDGVPGIRRKYVLEEIAEEKKDITPQGTVCQSQVQNVFNLEPNKFAHVDLW